MTELTRNESLPYISALRITNQALYYDNFTPAVNLTVIPNKTIFLLGNEFTDLVTGNTQTSMNGTVTNSTNRF